MVSSHDDMHTSSLSRVIAGGLTRWVGGITSWLLVAIVAVIAVSALFVTYVFAVGLSIAFSNNTAVQPLFLSSLAALVYVVFLWAALTWARRCSLSTVIAVSLAFALFLSTCYTIVFSTNLNTYPDIVMLDGLASALIEGRMSTFVTASDVTELISGNMSTYWVRVPYQAGGVLLFASIYKLFGVSNLIALQALNVIANMLSIASLIGISVESTYNETERSRNSVVGMTAVISCTFLPFLFSAAFAYTNSIGLCFTLIAFWISSRAWAHPEAIGAYYFSFFCGTAAFCIGIMMKTTLMLLSFAFCLAWMLDSLKTRRVWLLVCIPLALFVSLRASKVPVAILQWMTGCDFGEGQPFLMNIAMGLSWSDQNGLPGWWGSTSFDCYNQTRGDLAAQSAWCRDVIAQRVRSWFDDPRGAVRFFAIKLTTEWLEPSYMTLWFSERAAQPRLPLMEIAVHGSLPNQRLVILLDGMQTGLYALSSLGLMEVAHKAWQRSCESSWLLLAGSVFSGCICYLLWEAQSIYTLPFVFLVLPFCAMGAARVFPAHDTEL